MTGIAVMKGKLSGCGGMPVFFPRCFLIFAWGEDEWGMQPENRPETNATLFFCRQGLSFTALTTTCSIIKRNIPRNHECNVRGPPVVSLSKTSSNLIYLYLRMDGSIHERFELACALHSLRIRKRLYCVAAASWRRRPVMSDDVARSLQLPVLCIYNFTSLTIFINY